MNSQVSLERAPVRSSQLVSRYLESQEKALDSLLLTAKLSHASANLVHLHEDVLEGVVHLPSAQLEAVKDVIKVAGEVVALLNSKLHHDLEKAAMGIAQQLEGGAQ